MRKCRVIELKIENELFIQFCLAYGTPEQEKFRAIYESEEMAHDKGEVEKEVPGDGGHVLSDVRTDELFILRP